MKKQKSQKGIVLLSCLVFLLILTSLVKYTMSSAKMDELKSGADFDEMSAKEAALLAIKDAEEFILRRSYDGNDRKCLTDDNSVDDVRVCKYFTVKQDGEIAVEFWRKADNWKNGKTSGVYDGDDPDNRCNDETCSALGNVFSEWYKATGAEANECGPTDKPVICYGEFTGRKVFSSDDGENKRRAKYVIEVFRSNKYTTSGTGASPAQVNTVFGDILGGDPYGDQTIILRVTAVGYSQDVKDKGDFKKGAVPNDTYAMYQATYILSSE